MGSVTDGLDPWQFAQALGLPQGSRAVGSDTAYYGSGSATDGPHLYFGAPAPAAPAPPANGWWNAPAAAAAPPPAAAAPPPPPPPPPDPGPPPPNPFVPNPIGPGGPLTPQPTKLGNALGNSVLNPPQMFWVGGQDSYDNARRTTGQGRMTTTKT